MREPEVVFVDKIVNNRDDKKNHLVVVVPASDFLCL